MISGDFVNGCFEAVGAVSAWSNFVRLRRDRQVKGIVWQFTIFWFAWGIWNLYYYPSLGQQFSFWAGIALVAGNCAWLGLLAWIRFIDWSLKQPPAGSSSFD